MSTVPYLDLDAQYRAIADELWPALHRIFESNAFVLGPAVGLFEERFAEFCGTAHCVAVNSGTAALHLALLALGIGPGDEVITQANTFIATVAAIAYTGATPVLVDVVPPHYSIDCDAVRAALTPRTRAIVPVHLFGHPCDLAGIEAIGREHGLAVVEDASQAHGATFRGDIVGSRNTACFSFYPGKNLGAAGEGGAVVTRDAAIDARLRRLRNHGSDVKYVHEELGFNYRLEGLQGAVLGVKLPHLRRWTLERRRVAGLYDALLADVPKPERLVDTESSFHIYPILVERRDEVRAALADAGIETNVHYPVPCHLQPGYGWLGYERGAFPNSEYLAEHELSLPIFPELSDEQIEYVSARVRLALQR